MVIVTAVYIALTVDEIHWSRATDLPSGTTAGVVGAGILVLTGFGLGWVNTAADYSRYLPRSTPSRGVVFWPTFGGSLPVLVLVGYGLLLVRVELVAQRGRQRRPDRWPGDRAAGLVPGAVRAGGGRAA